MVSKQPELQAVAGPGYHGDHSPSGFEDGHMDLAQSATLQKLFDRCQAIAAELELESVVRTATGAAAELTGATTVAFCYQSETTKEVAIWLCNALPTDLGGAKEFCCERVDLLRSVDLNGETIRFDNLTEDPGGSYDTPFPRADDDRDPIRSYLAVPAVARTGKVIGRLFCGHPGVGQFTASSEQVARCVVSHAAVALENARLYREACDAAASHEQSRQVLMESEIRFRRMADNAPWMVWLSEADGSISFMSKSWYSLTGQAEDEALGDGWKRMLHPDDLAFVERTFEHARRTQTSFQVESRIRNRDGAYRWTLTEAAPRTTDDLCHGFIGSSIDIDDRKKVEDSLRLEKERLHKLAQTALTIGASRTMKSVTRVITDEARELIGSHQALTSIKPGKDWSEAVHAASFSDKYAEWRNRVITPIGMELFKRLSHNNEPVRMTTVELEASASNFTKSAKNHPPMRGWLAVPLMGRDGEILGLLKLSDKCEGEFTEADEAILIQLALMGSVAIENARLYDDLREQDRNKNEFLAMLAHELRNPLSPIRASIHLLRRNSLDHSQREDVHSIIERQMDTLVRLVDDLLDVSRVTRGKIQLNLAPTSIQDVLVQAMEMCAPMIKSQEHTVEQEFSAEPIMVLGDVVRLTQVFANILNNAVKYTEPQGYIKLTARREGNYAVVRIKDNGLGIAPETISRIFDLFTQAERSLARSQGGLGIGLALAKKLVTMHNGRITANSEGLGKGSEFVVSLPLIDPIGPESGLTKEMSDEKKSTWRILLVEDNKDNAEVLSLLLRLDGHDVQVAHDGVAALSMASVLKPDLILLDIGLPGKSGYEVAQDIRENEELSNVVLIAMTGYGQEEDKRRSREAGFDHHLTKPVSGEELSAVINRGLRDGR